ncbi:MAG: NUDIX domain-containing protein [Thermodesulfobacteriota bacterium]
MIQVATALLFDRTGKLLIYLRDEDKEWLPFPGHWDLFGGLVEEGETPEQALVREVKEELGYDLREYRKFGEYLVTGGDAFPNIKHVYWAKIDRTKEELTLTEGQRLEGISLENHAGVRFANILGQIVRDFAEAGLI